MVLRYGLHLRTECYDEINEEITTEECSLKVFTLVDLMQSASQDKHLVIVFFMDRPCTVKLGFGFLECAPRLE